MATHKNYFGFLFRLLDDHGLDTQAFCVMTGVSIDEIDKKKTSKKTKLSYVEGLFKSIGCTLHLKVGNYGQKSLALTRLDELRFFLKYKVLNDSLGIKEIRKKAPECYWEEDDITLDDLKKISDRFKVRMLFEITGFNKKTLFYNNSGIASETGIMKEEDYKLNPNLTALYQNKMIELIKKYGGKLIPEYDSKANRKMFEECLQLPQVAAYIRKLEASAPFPKTEQEPEETKTVEQLLKSHFGQESVKASKPQPQVQPDKEYNPFEDEKYTESAEKYYNGTCINNVIGINYPEIMLRPGFQAQSELGIGCKACYDNVINLFDKIDKDYGWIGEMLRKKNKFAKADIFTISKKDAVNILRALNNGNPGYFASVFEDYDINLRFVNRTKIDYGRYEEDNYVSFIRSELDLNRPENLSRADEERLNQIIEQKSIRLDTHTLTWLATVFQQNVSILFRYKHPASEEEFREKSLMGYVNAENVKWQFYRPRSIAVTAKITSSSTPAAKTKPEPAAPSAPVVPATPVKPQSEPKTINTAAMEKKSDKPASKAATVDKWLIMQKEYSRLKKEPGFNKIEENISNEHVIEAWRKLILPNDAWLIELAMRLREAIRKKEVRVSDTETVSLSFSDQLNMTANNNTISVYGCVKEIHDLMKDFPSGYLKEDIDGVDLNNGERLCGIGKDSASFYILSEKKAFLGKKRNRYDCQLEDGADIAALLNFDNACKLFWAMEKEHAVAIVAKRNETFAQLEKQTAKAIEEYDAMKKGNVLMTKTILAEGIGLDLREFEFSYGLYLFSNPRLADGSVTLDYLSDIGTDGEVRLDGSDDKNSEGARAALTDGIEKFNGELLAYIKKQLNK
jgi:hypothetical protein